MMYIDSAGNVTTKEAHQNSRVESYNTFSERCEIEEKWYRKVYWTKSIQFWLVFGFWLAFLIGFVIKPFTFFKWGFDITSWIMLCYGGNYLSAWVADYYGDNTMNSSGAFKLDFVIYRNKLLHMFFQVLVVALNGLYCPLFLISVSRRNVASKFSRSMIAFSYPSFHFILNMFLILIYKTLERFSSINVFVIWVLPNLITNIWYIFVLSLLPIPFFCGFLIIFPWLPYDWQDIVKRLRGNALFFLSVSLMLALMLMSNFIGKAVFYLNQLFECHKLHLALF